MQISNAIIILRDQPIKMDVDELKNFSSNIVWSYADLPQKYTDIFEILTNLNSMPTN